MSEIEKMKRYIERTKMNKSDRFCLCWPETTELVRTIHTSDDAIEVIALAFDYGKAKGYRAAKAEVRA